MLYPGATILPFEGKHPQIHETAFIAPGARIIGDVTIGPEASVWYNCVLRGDIHRMFLAEADRLGGLTVGTLDPDVLADAAWDLYKNRDSAETTFNVLT